MPSSSPIELRAELAHWHTASYGWALNCCGRDGHEAEDVLQSVYLKILNGKARFEGRASFQTWLFAVIRRTAADQRRRRIVRQVLLLRFEKEPARADPPGAPDEALGQSQRQSLFRDGLKALTRRQAEVLTLVFYHDLTIADAARVMGVSLGSARTHYERGKKQLRHWIEQKGALDEIRIPRPETQPALP